MKFSIGFILLPLLMLETIISTEINFKRRVVYGIFDGRTPCQELAKMLNEKTNPECTKIKWRLTLYKDSITGDPAGYAIEGFVYQRTTPRTGNWKILKGTKNDPDAVVFQLEGAIPMYFLQADENVLFFLDKEMNIMVGNRKFSYALNRK